MTNLPKPLQSRERSALPAALLWIAGAGFVALVVISGLTVGYQLARERAQTLEFVRSYGLASAAAVPSRAVRIVLAR